MNLNIKFLALSILGFSSLFFTACEKDNITIVGSQAISEEYIKQGQDAKSGTDDALVYLEIPEEYLAEHGEEMVLIEENGPFHTEDGLEVDGLIVIEASAENGTFFTIGVSQNLINLGIINDGGLALHKKPWIDYYTECMGNCYVAPAPLTCHDVCGAYASIAWLLQV